MTDDLNDNQWNVSFCYEKMKKMSTDDSQAPKNFHEMC